jgi:hypothetical protein
MLTGQSTQSKKWFGQLYLIGLAAHLFIVAVLYACPVSRFNLALPEGTHRDNIRSGSDAMSYVSPTRNMLTHGVFGTEDQPTTTRPIGYGLFLMAMMWCFGGNWIGATLIGQAIISACIYPALAAMAVVFLGPQARRTMRWTMGFVLVAGTYWAMAGRLYSDVLFTTLLTVGLALSVTAAAKRQWSGIILGWLLIGMAGAVRPILMAYGCIHPLFLFAAMRAAGPWTGPCAITDRADGQWTSPGHTQ